MNNPHEVRESAAKRKWFLGSALLAGIAFLPAVAHSRAQDEEEDNPVTQARTALEELMETQRLIGDERRDFALRVELLADHIELVEGENEDIQRQIEESRSKLTETEKERIALANEKEELEANAKELRALVTELEKRTQALVARLPEPAREKVGPLMQQMPDDPEETKLGTGQRFSFVVGTLTGLNKFNRQVSLSTEVLDLGDGRTAEVNALYVGVGQAYYATAAGDAAGIGTSSESGWVWTPSNQIAADVALAIEIQESKKPAAFVRLPVTIQ